MTIRNLASMFQPKSVAVIGASSREGTVGGVLARYLLQPGLPFAAYPVNPNQSEVLGVTAYPDVASLPEAPELAVIATPPATVPGIVAALGERGTKAAVVITAGFGEGGHEEGRRLRQAMLDAARPHLLRIAGPNCLGLMVPGHGLNASFAASAPLEGSIAFVAQSGAVLTSIVDWASTRRIGFSHLVSLGDMADVDFGDMLDYLANDRATSAILLYIEAIAHARKFMSAGRAAARSKPVIVVKAGRHAEGAKAAASHTGALAGADEVYDAAFRRAGMLRVIDLEELFDAVATLATARRPGGDRLGILTNGGGMGVLATDALIDYGGRLAELSPETVAALDACLPATWSGGNPVDIIGDAPRKRYADALAALVQDPGLDGLVVLNCPTAIASSTDAADATIEAAASAPRLPILASWVGNGATAEARRRFAQHQIPTYETPGQAVRAFMQLVNYQRGQAELMETPPSIPEGFKPDPGAARAVLREALEAGREWLTEPEAKSVLAAYDIPVTPTRIAADPAAAAAIAAEFGVPVALKILSPEITHKSDVGGVALNLAGAEIVQAAAESMLERVVQARPGAQIDGFTVQPMVDLRGAHELIAGVVDDRQFGPVLLFGQGGTAVEVINDKALALPPLNLRLAHEMVARTRVSRLLQGYRDVPGANLDAIAFTLVKVSQMVIDLDEIAEIDINPLLADPAGVVALDARVRVAEPGSAGAARLAIRPYPYELQREVALPGGRTLLLRPVRPEDEPSFHRTFARFTPEEIRMRFFVPMKNLSHPAAARFTQIDYDREMALVLTDPGRAGQTEIYGVVRIVADPDNEHAEFAIIVRGDTAGVGMGHLMMEAIIDYARGRGTGEIWGDVLRENRRMLELADSLGFHRDYEAAGDGTIVRVRLEL